MWTIFSLYWICYNIVSAVYDLGFGPWGIWDLSSHPDQGSNLHLWIERWWLNHWISREVPCIDEFYFFFNFILFFNFTILYWFCHISTWICHRYTHVPHPEPSSFLPPCTIPLGRPSALAPSIQYCALNLDWRLVSSMILYMFQCHSPKSSHPLPLPESKRLFYTSVSLLLSHPQGYCYHLSKFHIYALVYCIGVFLSGLLHSV